MSTQKIEKAGVSMNSPFIPSGTKHEFGIMACQPDGKMVYLERSVPKSDSMSEALACLYEWYNVDAVKKFGMNPDSVRRVFYRGAAYA